MLHQRQPPEVRYDRRCYFTSYELIEKLSDDGILGTRTVKEKRISGAILILDSNNALKKQNRTERGTYKFCCTESIFLTSWNDNSVFHVISNCHQVEPIRKVQQWVKGKGQI